MTEPTFPSPAARQPERADLPASALPVEPVIPVASADGLVFDEMVADLAAPVAVTEVLWGLPHRPGWHARYRHIEDYDEIERATKAADRARRKPNRKPGDIDINGLVASSILLATHNTGILRNGHAWMHEGEPVTFTSPLFIETMSRAAQAQGKDPIRKASEAAVMAYGWDADVLNHGNRLQEVSGWSGGDDDSDPTEVA